MESSATQPLSGVRVIDFTQVMLGPSATQVLADYGADVIKIERPGAGDLSRSSIPDDPDGLDNPVFRSLNRNKRSIALDLRKDDGKAIIYDLVREADVVVNNFRAGVMERMGFGYDELAKINPRIICAFGSGFGQSGPLSHKGGQDILAQALSGVMRAQMQRRRAAHRLRHVALRLHRRHASRAGDPARAAAAREDRPRPAGRGVAVRIDARHADAGSGDVAAARPAFLLGRLSADRRLRDERRRASCWSAPSRPTRCSDICAALGLPDLSADPRYATFAGQVAHKSELQAMFRERFASNTTEHWLARLDEQDLLCAPVLTLAEALGHEQTRANGTVVTLEGGADALPLDRHAARPWAEGAFQLRRPPPALGADGEAVLARGRLFGRAHRGPEASGHPRMSVLFSVADHVARVTIDRPERLNAVDQATEAELIAHLGGDRKGSRYPRRRADRRRRARVLHRRRHEGRLGRDRPRLLGDARPGGFGGIALRDTLDVPVIARVNGHALGGGLEMMLGCDIVVASADATFGLPEPRVGRLALDGGIALLARRIPHVQAMGMLLTGRRIGADEALRFGLVNEVVAPDELDEAVARWVADILACAPLSVRAIKQMVRAGERCHRQGGADAAPAGADRGAAIVRPGRGRAAPFKEKRAPQWRGR